MGNIHKDSVQNRFTAYLVAAVTNRRMNYFKKRNCLREQEKVCIDMLEKSYTDFGEQLHRFRSAKSAEAMEHWEDLQDVLALFESEKILKVIGKLKEREIKILSARVFGELTFPEMGEQFDMEPIQAEMAYYYIIRKIRKGLEGWTDEF